MAKESDEVKTVAQRLCRANGYHEGQRYAVCDGIEVPLWVTFVSRAEQLVKEREAFK